MDGYDREQNEEMERQVRRYEKSKRTGEKAWFDSDNYIVIIDWYFLNDQNEQAMQAVNEAYKLFSENEEIISRYAGMFAYENQYDKAIEILKQAIEKNPSEDLYTDLATTYIDSGQHTDEALEILNKAVASYPDYYFNYFLLGRIYLEKDELITAEYYLRQAIEREESKDDRMLLGCYTDCSHEPTVEQTMISFLYGLTQQYPFNDFLWVTLGIVYSRYKFIDEAIEAFDLAIAIDPKGELRHSCKADCLIDKQDYEKAKEELHTALQYAKDDPAELHLVLSGILMAERNYPEALMHLMKVDAKKEDISDRTYLLDMALCYYHLNLPDKAFETVKQAANEQLPCEIIIDFARKLYDHGFYQASEDLFELIITENTDSYGIELASVTLAALKAREGNTFEAVKIMENTLAELHTCTEDFWYAFLRISCQDRQFDYYTTETLRLLMTLDSFPTYIKDHYPEIFDNPNYKRCIKKLYHV